MPLSNKVSLSALTPSDNNKVALAISKIAGCDILIFLSFGMDANAIKPYAFSLGGIAKPFSVGTKTSLS